MARRRGAGTSPVVVSFILVLAGAVVLVLGLIGVVNLTFAGLLGTALSALAGAKLIAAVVYGGGLRALDSGLRELSAARTVGCATTTQAPTPGRTMTRKVPFARS